MPKPGPHTIGGFLPRAGLSLLLAVVAALAGCQAPTEPSGPTELVLRIPDYERFVDASLSVLRQYDLPPSRVDRPRGLIVSQPTTSAQWFEFWRVDAPGGYQSLEASLHTTRRVVTIQIRPLDTPPPGFVGAFEPAEVPDLTEWPESAEATAPPAPPEPADAAGAPRYHVQVQVDKLRYSAPERQVTTGSGALAIYSEKTPDVEGLRGPRSHRVEWVPLGRDPLLEAFLLQKIAGARPDVAMSD
ncbi:MAG: hypothetical protein KA383_03515 [Phycisphaerae bacterium]|nr:hypothetical protein [Phycisphaerae bacterium]